MYRTLFTLLLCSFTFYTVQLSFIKPLHCTSAHVSTLEDDVTHDGFKETIELNGTYLSEHSTFLKDITLSITNHLDKKWHIIVKEGYDPTITIEDITNNNKQNILYAVALNNERTLYHYEIFEFDQQQFKKIPLPSINHIEGEFIDQFQVKIQHKFKNQQWEMDVTNHKTKYIDGNIYKEDGTLDKQQKIQLSPIFYAEPFLLSTSKGHGLQTKQYIVGIDQDDIIATLETAFYYKNGKWTILTESISSI